MINENLALVPIQGVRDQGQVISQAGNQLFNALMQNKNMEHQQNVFDFRKEQHASDVAHRDRVFESNQNQLDLQKKEIARQKALQNMEFLGNAADKLLMTPPGQRQALAQTMMTELSQHMDPKTVARLASGPMDDGSLRRFKDTMDVTRKRIAPTISEQLRAQELEIKRDSLDHRVASDKAKLEAERQAARTQLNSLHSAVEELDVPAEDKQALKSLPAKTLEKVLEKQYSPNAKVDAQDRAKQEEKAQLIKGKVLDLVNELLENESGVRSQFGLDGAIPFNFSSSARNAAAALEDLTNLLTVENLGLMSGVLSESDMKVIQSVGASGLSGTDERVLKTLNEMKASLESRNGGQSGGNIDDLVNQYAD